MKDLFRVKSPVAQLLLVCGVAALSLFFFVSIGTFILVKITGISLQDTLKMESWDFSKPESAFFLRGLQVVQFISLFVIPSWFAAYFFSNNKKKYLGFQKPHHGSYFLISIVIILLAIPFAQWIGELNRQIHFSPSIDNWIQEKETSAERVTMGLLSRRTPKDLILNIIFIAGVAAVGEELLFRGVVQKLFIRIFKSPWAGILIAAFLFSALHLQFYGFLPRFLLGIILGAIYWYSGSIWMAMLSHFVYDAILIVLSYFYPQVMEEKEVVAASSLAFAGAVSMAITIGLMIWMKKLSKTRYEEVYAEELSQ